MTYIRRMDDAHHAHALSITARFAVLVILGMAMFLGVLGALQYPKFTACQDPNGRDVATSAVGSLAGC